MLKGGFGRSGVVCLALGLGACSSGQSSLSGGTGGTGGSAGSSSGSGGTSGGAGSGGSAGAAGTGGGAGMSGTGGTAGADGGSGAAGTDAGGSAGSDAGADADAGPTWPTCDHKPATVTAQTIPEIWASNPQSPTVSWISGVYITAISGGACSANRACQVFLQQDETYASFAAGAQHGIRMWISAAAASHFLGLAVGDRVDAMGDAWRFNLGGQNELLIEVNDRMPGCAKKVGTGHPTPVTGVQLSELTTDSYETTHGPLLVQVSTVTGKPGPASQIFGIWVTGVGIGDAGPNGLVSVSPYFLPGYSFTGLPTDGQTAVDFQTVTGVFGLYVRSVEGGSASKYVVLYPRTMSELAQ